MHVLEALFSVFSPRRDLVHLPGGGIGTLARAQERSDFKMAPMRQRDRERLSPK